MTIKRLRSVLKWAVLVAILLTSGLVASSVIAQSTCKVELGKGWAGGAGRGTITMKNDGKPCGAPMYTVPEDNIPVDSIKVVSPPKYGTVSIKMPQFFYTPNPGFTGQDRFGLIAEGPDRGRQQRIRLQGDVTVEVQP